jgi:hypothetical protein
LEFLSLSPHLNGVIVGDFSLVLNSKEKSRGSKVKDPCKYLVEDLISNFGFVDIKPRNRKYTRTNKRSDSCFIVEKYDRFLIQETFLNDGLSLSSSIILSAYSNHKPIFVNITSPTNFRPLN